MPSTIYNRVQGSLRPIKDHVLVVNMERGERTSSGGVIVLDDDGKSHGIRPRWCQVWRVGEDNQDLIPGQWILVEHGRWTYGITMVIPEGDEDEEFYVQRVDIEGILLVADECPL